MNGDYNQEYRSYGSYLSRVIAIIVALVLLVVAVWFVVRLASEDDNATIGDATRNVISLDENTLEDNQSNNDQDQNTEQPAEDTSSDQQPTDNQTDDQTENQNNEQNNDQADQNDQNDQQDQADQGDQGHQGDQSDEVAVASNDDTDAESTTPQTGGQVLSTNTDELPTTGGELGLLVFLPLLTYFGSKRLLRSQRR